MAGSPLGVTYYPSCVVNMRVKFDEAYQIGAGKDIASYAKEALSKQGPILSLPQQGAGLSLKDDINAEGSHITARIPIKASVELSGIRKPGKFSLTFDFRVLPIDPRLVRSAAVEIYMDSVSAANFAAGVTAPSMPGGERISQITTASRLSAITPTVENLVLQGLVDSWRVQHTTNGSLVFMEGRDMTGLFLNTPITPEMVKNLDLSKPIDKVVEHIAYSLNGWNKKIAIVASPDAEWPQGKVPSLAKMGQLDAGVPRVRYSARGKKLRRSPGARVDKLNFWDLITRYCGFVGAVPYFTVVPIQNSDPRVAQYMPCIRIVPQRNLYDQLQLTAAGEAMPAPFRGGTARNDDRGSPFKVRRLLFGRNIEELNLERKFMGITARAVKVICYNPGSNGSGPARLMEAISTDRQSFAQAQGAAPIATDTEAAGRSGVTPNGEYGAKDMLVLQVNGVKSQADLQQLADGYYNEIMRGEMGGNVKTRSLSSFGAGNEDPDLIRIRPMDGIALMVDSRALSSLAPSVSPLNSQAQMSDGALEAELTKQLGDPNLASAIVATSRNSAVEYHTTYRVNAVKFDWDVKSGISVALDFHNYVIPRNSIYPTIPMATAAATASQARVVPAPAPGAEEE